MEWRSDILYHERVITIVSDDFDNEGDLARDGIFIGCCHQVFNVVGGQFHLFF